MSFAAVASAGASPSFAAEASPTRSDANASVFSNNGRVTKWTPQCTKCGKKHLRPPKDWTCVQCKSKVWQPDDDAASCSNCGTSKMSKFKRHHCRSCGNLVCDSCSKFSMCIPEWGVSDKYRVCSLCTLPSTEEGFSGYLYKQGSKNMFGQEKFQRRWFQIRGTTLVYGASPSSGFHGAINLTNAKVIDDPGHPHSFRILGPHLQRGYVLSAENDESKTAWMKALDDMLRGENDSHRNNNNNTLSGRGDSATRFSVEGSPQSPNSALDGRELSVSAAVSLYYSSPQAATAYLKSHVKEHRIGITDFDLITVLSATPHSTVVLGVDRATSTRVVFKIYEIEKVLHAPQHACYSKQAVLTERAVLSKMAAMQRRNSSARGMPFVTKLHHAFETKTHLFLVTEWSSGGDLLLHLRVCQRFTEDRARLIALEVAIALAALHDARYIYGALQLEHVTIRSDGHVALVGFNGVVMRSSSDINEAVHAVKSALSAEYTPPETYLNGTMQVSSDYWCLGILLFEMVTGAPPFYSMTDSADEVRTNVLSFPLDFPRYFSADLKELLYRLLDRNPNTRLSSFAELLTQPFFKNTDVDAALRQKLVPDFIPDPKFANELKYTDARFTCLPVRSYAADVPTESVFPGYVYPAPLMTDSGEPSEAREL